ncbi:MAG: metal ABC transporter substrate-binding protein [Anaerolineales bacterium]
MKINKICVLLIFTLVILSVFLVGCSVKTTLVPSAAGEKLKVVTTTSFVGDVVGVIAGQEVELIVLLEPGQNPHAYQTAPQDMVNVSEADLIFVNGLGLEEFLDDLIAGTGNTAAMIMVSDGIFPLERAEQDHEDEGQEGDGGHTGSDQDPHVWFDPNNIIIWTENIAGALAEKDPENADTYLKNAAAYREELKELDGWIRNQVALIPLENRELVTDHMVFGYFVEEYGFTQIGAVIPAQTTEAETSGQQLAYLIDIIQEEEVKAIFIGVDFDPTLSRIVAEDTGVDLVPLYFGSLSAGAPAGTYLTFMRHNVKTIVNALQ